MTWARRRSQLRSRLSPLKGIECSLHERPRREPSLVRPRTWSIPAALRRRYRAARGDASALTFWHEDETWNLIKSLAPQVVINDRLCVLGGYGRQPDPYRGDFYTPEQRIGGFDTNRP